MPRTPKKTLKTGSVLLGRELRRLRGARSLRDIVELTRSRELAGQVVPVSEAGLCEIESGKTMPLLATLHSLSVVYKTSMGQLMTCVTEERMSAVDESAASSEQLATDFASALDAREWSRALRFALLGERRAENVRAQVAWRANRASCLTRMGLHDECIITLTECSESKDLAPEQRFLLLHNLSVAHHNAGYPGAATRVAREALELAERANIPREAVRRLELQRAIMLVEAEAVATPAADERRVREAGRLVSLAAKDWPEADLAGNDMLSIVTARVQFCLGNLLVAGRDMERVVRSATEAQRWSTSTTALLALASVRERQGRMAEAGEHLQEALAVSEKSGEPDQSFEASIRLYLLHRDTRPGTATAHLRRCAALFPATSARTHWTRTYVAVERARTP